jgi:signal transduction histidine kinase
MKRLRRFNSLSFRLSAMIALVVFAGISVIVTSALIRDFRQTMDAERARLTSVVAAFSSTVAPALRDLDARGAYTVLRGIRDLPNTSWVSVRTVDGETLAEIGSGTTLAGKDSDLDTLSMFGFLKARTITTSVPVRDSGIAIGTLEMLSDITNLRARYVSGLQNSLLWAFTLAMATAVAAFLTIGRLVSPLRTLSDDLLAMGEKPDLSKRFEASRRDEIGVLADAFNAAFETIEESDQALRRHRDTLEQTVEERTKDLWAAMQDAQKANAAKSEFLATMSHEIRTPMNGMMVMAELLTASPLSPKHHRYAEVISRSGRSLLNIINDILDLSKIESGKTGTRSHSVFDRCAGRRCDQPVFRPRP